MSGKLSVSTFSTRLGWMALVETPQAVVRLSFGHSSPKSALKHVAEFLEDGVQPTDAVSPLAKRLAAFANGASDDFSDVAVQPHQQTPFCRNVVKRCRRIEYGQTMTYGDLATAAGNPRAARAVGNCMARNTVPLIVPCHRVVAASGRLGGYSAGEGTRLKLRLLEMEKP